MKFKNILFTIISALTLFACNKAKSEKEHTISNDNIESNYSLPDSIIDAGIVKYSLRTSRDGKKDSYYSKAVEAHEYYTLLPIINDNPTNEKRNSYYSEAINNYSLSLEKKEFQHREDIVLQNRAALKMNHGDYYGAISDYNTLLNMRTSNVQEYQVLKAYCHLKAGEIDKSELLVEDILRHSLINTENAKEKKEDFNTNSGFNFDLPERTVDNTFLASAYYYKGIISYLKGNKKVACQSWSKASELNEDISRYAALDTIQEYCK